MEIVPVCLLALHSTVDPEYRFWGLQRVDRNAFGTKVSCILVLDLPVYFD